MIRFLIYKMGKVIFVKMKAFLEELAELLEVNPVGLTSSYRLADNENWDSLALISVVVMIDEHFKLSVSNERLRECKLVGDLQALIHDRAETIEI